MLTLDPNLLWITENDQPSYRASTGYGARLYEQRLYGLRITEMILSIKRRLYQRPYRRLIWLPVVINMMIAPSSFALGDAGLSSLIPFIEDIFRIQIDSAEVVSRRHGAQKSIWPGLDQDSKLAIRPIELRQRAGRALECQELDLRNFREVTKEHRENPNAPYSIWSIFSPVYVIGDEKRGFLKLSLRSAQFSVAVRGVDFDIDKVVDSTNHKFTSEARRKVISLPPSGNFGRLYTNHLKDKHVYIANKTVCDGFVIFELEIS